MSMIETKAAKPDTRKPSQGIAAVLTSIAITRLTRLTVETLGAETSPFPNTGHTRSQAMSNRQKMIIAMATARGKT